MAYPFHIDPRNAKGAKDEIGVQVAYRSKLRTLAPRVLLVAIPNAGKRTAWEARERAREGMVKGFPYMLALYEGTTLGLECKSVTGQPSDNQLDTLGRMHRLGFPVGIFRSAESALDWTRQQIPEAFNV